MERGAREIEREGGGAREMERGGERNGEGILEKCIEGGSEM